MRSHSPSRPGEPVLTQPRAASSATPVPPGGLAVGLVLFGLWCAYCFHGVIVERGVVGWIQALMFEWTGSAGSKLPFLLAMMLAPLASIPALALVGLVAKLVKRGGERAPDTTHAAGVLDPEERAVRGRRLTGLAAAGLLGLGVALVVLAFGPAYPSSPPATATVELRLDEARGALPEGSWIGLVGTVQGRSAIGFRKGSAVHTYVPLTEQGWTPDQPVRVVWDARKATRPPPPGTPIVVRLRRTALPLYAQRAFEKQGLRFADPYWLAEGERSAETMIALLVLAAVLLFFGGALAWAVVSGRKVEP